MSNPKPVEGVRVTPEMVQQASDCWSGYGPGTYAQHMADVINRKLEAALSAAPARDGVRAYKMATAAEVEVATICGHLESGKYRIEVVKALEKRFAAALAAPKEQADGQVVLANRCMRHRHIKPMNAVCADGAECPICALHIPPDTKDCVRCGAPRESTIHDTGSSNTEIRMAAHQFVAGVKD